MFFIIIIQQLFYTSLIFHLRSKTRKLSRAEKKERLKKNGVKKTPISRAKGKRIYTQWLLTFKIYIYTCIRRGGYY